MTEPSLLQVLERAVRACDAAEVPYMLMGGLAVAVHAVPRPTLDVDLTIDADAARLQRLLDAAQEEGFVVPDHYRRGFADTLKGMAKLQIQSFVEDLEHDVDLFLVTTPYQRAAFARRRRGALAAREYMVIAPEDLILHKLLTGRGRDESDVEDILFLQGPMDADHLNRWAETLGLASVLARKLRNVAGEGPA